MTYILGRDFGRGERDHAIAPDAKYLGSANTNHFGYQEVYAAMCGRKVWKYTTLPSARPSSPWVQSYRSCRMCVKKIEKGAVMTKPLRVPVTIYVTLDEEAQQAWMEAYNVERKELRDDVKRYFGNAVTGEDFKNIIGTPIQIEWK